MEKCLISCISIPLHFFQMFWLSKKEERNWDLFCGIASSRSPLLLQRFQSLIYVSIKASEKPEATKFSLVHSARMAIFSLVQVGTIKLLMIVFLMFQSAIHDSGWKVLISFAPEFEPNVQNIFLCTWLGFGFLNPCTQFKAPSIWSALSGNRQLQSWRKLKLKNLRSSLVGTKLKVWFAFDLNVWWSKLGKIQ